MGQSGFLPLNDEPGGGGVAPAALEHEAVPDFDLFGIRLAPVLKAPLENLLIGAALQGAGRQGVEIDVEETAHAVIEAAAAGHESQMISGRQAALLGIETNLVEDAAEDDDAADSVARGTKWECHGEGK